MKTRQRNPASKSQEFNFAYTKDQILAQQKDGKAVLFKVMEDMKTNDNRSRLRVIQLEQKEQKNGKVVYKEGGETLLPVKDKMQVVEEVEVKKQKANPRSKSAVTFFTFQQETIEDLAENAKLQRGQAPPKQPPKKVNIKSEESEEDDEIPVKKYTIKKGSKKELKIPIEKEPKKPTVKQKQESDGEVSSEEQSEYSSSQPKRGRNTQSQSQSQNKKGKGSKKQKTPTKFTRGKFNPNYTKMVDIMQQWEGTSTKFKEYSSIKTNNKEIIRAAKIGSIKLLEDIFSHPSKISNLFERWGPENDKNAIEILFERQDKAMLQRLLQSIGKLKLGVTPRCSLKEIQTGYNDKYAYGTRTRKVAVGRGGREGNNAFAYDLSNEQPWDQYMVQKLMQIETDPAFFDLISATIGNNTQNTFFEMIASAVRCGNFKTAGHLVKEAFTKGSYYGFNQVHVDVLNMKTAVKFGDFKKPSATKKTTGSYLFTPIHCACINPNHEFLAKLLDISQEFNILDEQHRKPVHYAAASQTTNCLDYLLKNGIDAREGDRNKTTPLMVAAQYGRAHNVELLAANNVNGKNRDGNAAIHMACFGGHVEAVKMLLKFGAQINQPGQYRMTPIIIASAYGHFELVEYLHSEGAKLLARDKYGRSSTIMAARNGNLSILSFLLQHGADYNQPDSSKNTALHYAAAYGFPECIEQLIEAGADQNLVNSWKLTPLSVALQKNHFGVVKTLLNYPTTDVNCKDDEGRTLISSSLSQFTADSMEYIRFLIVEKQADVTIPDLQGRTPLHYAVEISRKTVKQYYQKWNELPKTERKQIKDKYTELIEEMLQLLLNNKGDVNCPDLNGQTPFIQCLIQQNFQTADLLMRISTPQVDSIDKYDKNILHKLIDNKLFLNVKGFNILETILKQLDSSYINQLDENGWTPFLALISQYCQEAQPHFLAVFNKKVASLQKYKYEQEMAIIDSTLIDEEGKPLNNLNESSIHSEDNEDEDNEDEEDEDEEEEIPRYKQKRTVLKARTHQTARRGMPLGGMAMPFGSTSSGGLFGTSTFGATTFGASTFAGFGNPQSSQLGQQANTELKLNQKTFYYRNKTIIVYLTQEENSELYQQATKASFDLQNSILSLIAQMVSLGANVDAVVEKRKKYRDEEPKLDDPTYDPYTADGTKGIAHFIFNYYHSTTFLKGLLNIKQFDLSLPTLKNEYPIHHFARTCSIHPICYRSENSIDFLKTFINQVDIRVKNMQRQTALSILAERYYPQLESLITFLIENGGQIDNLSKENVVPLQKWVKSNNLKFVEQFLTVFKADPNFQDKDKRNSLHHAINRSNSQADASFEMELLLLQNGVRADAVDRFGRTPLFYAFTKIGQQNEKSEIDPFETVSSILADKNCAVDILDIYQRSPLHYAALRGSVISGRYMIKLGAPVDMPDKYGNTPIGLSFISGHSNFCTMLIDNKADVERNAIIVDYVKLHAEEKRQRNERREKGEEIESEGEDVDKVDDEYDDNGVQQKSKFPQSQFGAFGGNYPKAARKQAAPGIFGQQAQQTAPQPTSFQAGSYSYFKLAIKHGWQGVAYLLISDGFDLQRAIEDAMMEGQFKLVRTLLMKVKDDAIVRKSNSAGNNLYHIFAMKGSATSTDYDLLIAEELIKRGVDRKQVNNLSKTPLHYAAEHNFFRLIDFLLNKDCNPNHLDFTNNTPFTIRLQMQGVAILHRYEFEMWIRAGTNMNQRFTVFDKDYELNAFLYLLQEHNLEDEISLNELIERGTDINEANQVGETALIIAIKKNSMKLVNFLLSNKHFIPEKHSVDKKGKTPIHHVVQPLEFGSYENEAILKALLPIFNHSQKDLEGKTPLDYANNQDSQLMANILKKHNAQATSNSRQQRLPTSIVAQAEWVEQEIDVEADAQKLLDSVGEQIDESKKDPNTEVDTHSHQQGGKLEVYIDPELGPYSLLMTKVDIGNGLYSENVFYKMQVLHEINRNVYILFTRWGRIGTEGQYQMTPFENAEMATKEYQKIFSSKAGNDWRKICKEEEPFEKKPNKYQLMTVGKNKSYKHILEPFDFSKKSPYPPCKLEKSIRRVLLQFIQVKLYQKDLEQFHIDMDFMPIERLDRKQIEKAKAILYEIQDLVDDLIEQRKQTDLDIKKIQDIQSELCQKTSRFYELIPQRELRTEPLPPFENRELLQQKLVLIETLLNFEITSKILLGAHLNKLALNPLNYCFNALNVRILTLPKEHPEYKCVAAYALRSDTIKISNIFAIERRGEAQRFEQHKQFGNRMLLWHGSKISNYMGILAQGLKIAPPWAFNTGAMFGKGIYFADMFQKSYGYTQDWALQYNSYNGIFQDSNQWGGRMQQHKADEQEEIQRYRYMLLCEVAVGNSKELYASEHIDNLGKNYQSVKGLGARGPDYAQSITLANGCRVPVGDLIHYKLPNKKDKNGNQVQYQLQHNEYIIYDETKTKVRYLVQIDTKHTVDEYI